MSHAGKQGTHCQDDRLVLPPETHPGAQHARTTQTRAAAGRRVQDAHNLWGLHTPSRKRKRNTVTCARVLRFPFPNAKGTSPSVEKTMTRTWVGRKTARDPLRRVVRLPRLPCKRTDVPGKLDRAQCRGVKKTSGCILHKEKFTSTWCSNILFCLLELQCAANF